MRPVGRYSYLEIVSHCKTENGTFVETTGMDTMLLFAKRYIYIYTLLHIYSYQEVR